MNIKKFASFLTDKTGLSSAENPEVKHEEFLIYLSLFVNTCMVKKKMEEPAYQLKADCINELLYSYSHTKFESFVNIPEVSLLIRMMFVLNPVEHFVRSTSSLSVKEKEYTKHVQEILRSINY